MHALLEDQMIGRLHDICEMEADLQRLLDDTIENTDDTELRDKLEEHSHQSHHHEQRLVERLQAYGESARPNPAQPGDATTPANSAKTEADGEKHAAARDNLSAARDNLSAARDNLSAARDNLSAARMKVAFYEQLERNAAEAGDKQTARVARRNREEEQVLTEAISAIRARDAPK